MTDLQEAFREAARREFAMVPDEDQLDYTFSPGFQRKMRRIIRAQVHGYWSMVNTLGKRIAIAAAIIVMLLTTAMAIKPVRERVIQFFVEVYEEYFAVSFGKEDSGDLYASPEPMVRYTFSELPPGYYEEKFVEADSFLWTFWKNSEGQGIIFQQEAGAQNITVDYSSSQLITITHNELQIAFQEHNGTKTFVWSQDEYTFHLTIYEELSTDRILSLIDSLFSF